VTRFGRVRSNEIVSGFQASKATQKLIEKCEHLITAFGINARYMQPNATPLK